MSGLAIKVTDLGQGGAFLKIAGYLDSHTFGNLERTLEGLFGKNIYRLIVDLREIEYLSSAGAGVFIQAVGTAETNGGTLVLVNPTHNVNEVFDLLGLKSIFTIANSVEEACKLIDG